MKTDRFSISELAGIPCERPGRYTGGEVNSIKPSEDAKLSVCLLFPDLYDLGVSYFGFQILYHLFNRQPGVSCERSCLPWEDMQSFLRRRKKGLYALESGRFLRDYDLIGVTLQTELHYPGVVKALDLAGIPRRAAERGRSDPVVIGGGPCAFHPEPVAPFFDAFVIGDGEEVVPELTAIMSERDFQRSDRPEKWRRLASLKGVYVPGLYEADSSGHLQPQAGAPELIHTRITRELKREYYPDHPYVPNVAAAHDRLTVEIMRGCSQGCRFCQAGMIHRPVRERPPEEILAQVMTGLDNTGWDELGLLSLSTSDYRHCHYLIPKLVEALAGRRVAVSFPSLRPGSFTDEIASLDTGGRKVSLTFALEAGSERLRAVINKSLHEEELFEAIDRAFRHGWNGVKLYFMVGLPTERESDVLEGAELLTLISRRIPRGKSLNLSVAPFIPKPFSVFEREAYLDPALLLERQQRLVSGLRGRGFKAVWRDPDESLIEAALCRGDRRMAKVIEEVAEAGSGFEAWGSEFSRERWFAALNRNLPDWRASVARIPSDANTPWDHITKGLTPKFLAEEMRRSEAAQRTPDCREDSCVLCGLMNVCDDFQTSREHPESPIELSVKTREALQSEIVEAEACGHQAKPVEPCWRFRMEFTKLRQARYLGHHDLMRAVERSLLRAGLPLSYSQGFNPRPLVSFGPALPLGVGARLTWIEFQTNHELDPTVWRERIQHQMPNGLRLLALKPTTHKKGKSDSEGGEEERCYRIRMTAPLSILLSQTSEKDVDHPRWLKTLSTRSNGRTVFVTIHRDGERFPKPGEVGAYLCSRFSGIPSAEDASGVGSVTLI